MNSQSDDTKLQLTHDLQELMVEFLFNVKPRQSPIIDQEFNLSVVHQFVLTILLKKGVLKASDIAKELNVTTGAVTGLTDKLLGFGLINRERLEDDRRVVQISLTKKGEEKAKEIMENHNKLLRKQFEILNEDELLMAIKLFRKLNNLTNKKL